MLDPLFKHFRCVEVYTIKRNEPVYEIFFPLNQLKI